MHRLLARQIKRHKLAQPDIDKFCSLFDDIDLAYKDHDQERNIIERSLDLTSEELNERNQALRSKLDLLETTHNKLEDSLSVLNSIFDSTGEAILGFDHTGRLLRNNHMATEMFGLTALHSDASQSLLVRELLKKITRPKFIIKELKKLKEQPSTNLSGTLELMNNETLEFHSSAQLVNKEIIGRVWCFRNVTTAIQNEILLKHRAYHDALTDLPNRLLLLDRLEQHIYHAKRDKLQVGVLFIDLDHFKKINDTLGHQRGDQLLVEVANRIKGCLRESDTLARLGGDEFVVVLGEQTSHKFAAKSSNRIIESLQTAFEMNSKKYFISSSVGISFYPQDGESSEELIRKSDLAMYSAKKTGGGCFHYFDSALERIAHYNLDLEGKLRQAINAGQLEVFYQPKVRVNNGEHSEAEALLRWTTDDGQQIPPSKFIPLAEQVGLIVAIGYWVIEEVSRQIKQWKSQGINTNRVSINLSAQQFKEENFVERVKQILEEYELSGEDIEWEITESILLEDLNAVSEVLVALKELGSTISIDDFGTGYSSLQYLQKLPVDTLKIDRSFILELGDNPSEESLVSGIISLAHNIKLTVVAEGVEDKNIVEYLARKNCDFIQGFYYYKPMNSQSMTRLLLA